MADDPRLSALTSSGLLPEIFAAVEPAYPFEGCGFVFRDDARGALVHVPTSNRAPELHARDPLRYPRGGSDWFEPDMRPWLVAARAGLTPWLIYHSHPDERAYFSTSDVDMAVQAGEGGVRVARHPSVDHMVISVRGGRAVEAVVVRFAEDRGVFETVGSLARPE